MQHPCRAFFSILVFLATVPSAPLFSQEQEKPDTLLEGYVAFALENNLELQAAGHEYDASVSRKRQAFSVFLPSLTASTRYTRTNGQSYTLPFGQMLNPIYEKLWPGVPIRAQDVTLDLLPRRRQETTLEAAQIVFNLPAYFAYRLQRTQSDYCSFERRLKRIAVTASVHESYYAYAKALQLLRIKEGSHKLANEHYKTVQRLSEVDKATKTDLLRAQMMQLSTEQELTQAQNDCTMAQNAFNTVLNRGLDMPIGIDTGGVTARPADTVYDRTDTLPPVEAVTRQALMDRVELLQLDAAVESARHALAAARSAYLPTAVIAGQYGFQDERYRFNKGNDRWAVSGFMSWNLFSGGATHAKAAELQSAHAALLKKKSYAEQMIRLEVKNSVIDVSNTRRRLAVAARNVRLAEENYRATRKRYEEGMESLLRLMDSQTALDSAQAQYVVMYYSLLLSKTTFQRSMGTL